MTVERARQRAQLLDSATDGELKQLRLGPPRAVLTEIRTYLIRRSEVMKTKNNPIQLLRFRQENLVALIVLGPTIDRGPTDQHFNFDSGARLSFGLTLRVVDDGSRLVSFRYHYVLPAGGSPKYIRFDLNDAPHVDPLLEPRCHLHPGLDDARIPFAPRHPIEVLDRIFFALEKQG